MNIHEYQAKDLLATYGVRIQRGIVADSKEKAVKAAKELNKETGTEWYVVKAQIHAGGRGKGGGVKLAKSIDDVASLSDQILGMQLVTHQTGPEGKRVNKVLIAQDVFYPGPDAEHSAAHDERCGDRLQGGETRQPEKTGEIAG